MPRLTSIVLSCVILILCAHFGTQQSQDNAKEKHKINFRGELLDTNGNHYQVDNISITGIYRQIPIYAKPSNPTTDPAVNTTYIDLDEIAAIAPTINPPHDGISTFDKRQFIDITVTSKDSAHTKTNYIIDRNRKIFCDVINQEAGPIEKEISFEAVSQLIITGFEKREDMKLRPASEIKKPEKTIDITKPTQEIQELTTLTQKISDESLQKEIQQHIDSLKTLING